MFWYMIPNRFGLIVFEGLPLFGLATLLPLAAAIWGLRRRVARSGAGWALWIAIVYIAAVYVLLHVKTFADDSPEQASVSMFVLTSAAVAFALLYRAAKHKPFLIASMFVACVLDMITNVNTAFLALFLIVGMFSAGWLRARTAVIVAGAYLAVLAVCYYLVPIGFLEWMLWLPRAHYYPSPLQLAASLAVEWRAHPWQPTVTIAALGALAFRAATGRAREASFLAIALAGVMMSCLISWADVGGNSDVLWMLYAICLIPIAGTLDQTLQAATLKDGEIDAMPAWQKIVPAVGMALFVLLLPIAVVSGSHTRT